MQNKAAQIYIYIYMYRFLYITCLKTTNHERDDKVRGTQREKETAVCSFHIIFSTNVSYVIGFMCQSHAALTPPDSKNLEEIFLSIFKRLN